MYTTDVFIGSVASVEFYDMEYSVTNEERIAELEKQIQESGVDGGMLTSDLIDELQQLLANKDTDCEN